MWKLLQRLPGRPLEVGPMASEYEPVYGLPRHAVQQWLARNPELRRQYEVEAWMAVNPPLWSEHEAARREWVIAGVRHR